MNILLLLHEYTYADKLAYDWWLFTHITFPILVVVTLIFIVVSVFRRK
jgi:hypothetical protein